MCVCVCVVRQRDTDAAERKEAILTGLELGELQVLEQRLADRGIPKQDCEYMYSMAR